MAYIGDFLVEDGVAKRYIGIGGDLIVPEGVREIGDSAFINCAAVTYAELPEGVEIIRAAAFSWRTGLLGVKLPHSLRIIEEGAFEGCSSLKNVVVPEGTEEIHVAAFHGCQQMETMEIPKSLKHYDAFMEEGCMTAIKAPGISLSDIPEHYRINAAHGLAYMPEADEEQRCEYMQYIRENISELCRRAEKSMPLLQFLMKEELIDCDTLEGMLKRAIEKKDFDMTASLLDYQGRLMTPEKLKERAKQEEERISSELWEF